jgi:hypothetical protein
LDIYIEELIGFKGIFSSVIVSKINHSHSNSISKLSHVPTEFLQWLSGFTDAEGNFLISLDRNYVRFRFKISLHTDDIAVLNLIKFKLGIGIVTEENSKYCSFVVQKFDDIKDVICPIFSSFPLQTKKRLDFNDFYEVVKLKSDARGNKITANEIDKIVFIKNNMNNKRIIEKSNILDADCFTINPN